MNEISKKAIWSSHDNRKRKTQEVLKRLAWLTGGANADGRWHQAIYHLQKVAITSMDQPSEDTKASFRLDGFRCLAYNVSLSCSVQISISSNALQGTSHSE